MFLVLPEAGGVVKRRDPAAISHSYRQDFLLASHTLFALAPIARLDLREGPPRNCGRTLSVVQTIVILGCADSMARLSARAVTRSTQSAASARRRDHVPSRPRSGELQRRLPVAGSHWKNPVAPLLLQRSSHPIKALADKVDAWFSLKILACQP